MSPNALPDTRCLPLLCWLGRIDGRRKAQKPLAASYKKAKSKGFKQRSRAISKAIRWKHKEQEPTFAEAARGKLAPLVDKFFTAAAADLSDIKALHQMRISGKQVRYTMELLAGAFDESFRRELYVIFAEVQEMLGTINDHANAVTMFHEWRERADNNGSQAALAELIAKEKTQLDAECQGFRDWWTTERARDLADHFAMLLQLSSSSTVARAPVEGPREEATEEMEADSAVG